MQHVDFKKVFTLAGITGKCESLSITIDDGKVIEGGTASLQSGHEEPISKITFDTTAKLPTRCDHYYQFQSAPRKFTRALLKHLIVKWPSRQHPSQPKDCIALAEKDSFSVAFNNALGTANTTNISDLGDDQGLESFFEAFLEREAPCQFRSGRNKHLQEIMNINEGWNRDGMTVSGELGTDNELRWSLNSGITKGTSWTRLLRCLFNLSRMDAIATLANILWISFENFYQLSSEKHAAELNGRALQSEDVPTILNIEGGSVVILKEKTYTYGNAGQTIGRSGFGKLDRELRWT